MGKIEDRKEVAAQQYALDKCQDDVSQLIRVKDAWVNGFETGLLNKYDDLSIKGQSLDDWENWIISELKPPLAPIMTDEVIYTMEAFLELIKMIKN